MYNEQRNTKAKKKTKKLAGILLVIILVLILPYAADYFDTKSSGGESVQFTIEPGTAVSSVAQKLDDEGLIKSKYTFMLKYRLNSDLYQNVYAGTHTLNTGMCLKDIMDSIFLHSPDATFSLTVPEGYSIEMIAKLCDDLNICTEDEFISAAKMTDYSYDFIDHIPEGNYKYKLEGFLFPSTYEFFENATAHDIIDKMLSAFETEYKKNFQGYDKLFEIMTIASMIEREAVLDSERATISGVIQNRLKKPMMLQIDATVVYAKSNGRYDMTRVTNEDLKVDSPYNLYMHEGLTPGPICSPGIKSIIAAANPEAHNYLFYHTDEAKKDGSHIFTETFDAHLQTMN